MFSCNDHHQCKEEAFNRAKHLCDERNLRFTELRQRVFDIVWESHQPVKAYDIIRKMSSEAHTVKPPIVYRSLDFLLEHRLIHKLTSVSAYTGCKHPTHEHDCAFLICTACNNAQEFCHDELSEHILGVIDMHSFSKEKKIVEVLGTCQNCR